MKKLTMLMAFLVSSSAFALGTGQKWDFRQGIKPVGYNLGQVCYDQGSYISTVSKTKCVDTKPVLADDDQRYELFPRMINTCVKWKTTEAGQVLAGQKMGCTEWKRVDLSGADEGSYGDDENINDYKYVCAKEGLIDIPRTQRLDVYYNFSGSKNIHSDDQLVSSELFTVPACESNKSGDLPDEDVPDTKK